MKTSLAEAQALIERMKAAKAECEDCARIRYDGSFRHESGAPLPLPGLIEALTATIKQHLESLGFEEMPNRPGFMKRCAKCADTPRWPWARWLDAERVAKYAANQPGPFPLDDLEPLAIEQGYSRRETR